MKKEIINLLDFSSMKTTTSYQERIFTFVYVIIFIFIYNFSFSQSNCIVSSISGPSVISGTGTITKLYTVGSNGQHIWTLPSNLSLVSYGSSGNDSITVSFAPNFTSGTITVRRNGPSCTNIKQSIQVIRNSCNMSVNVGNDTKLYYGYSPLACANISVSVSNGSAPFSYSWSNGANGSSIKVCPSKSTSYEVIVTDANGCTAKDALNVCVVDVRCSAGRSAILKVEVCHKNRKTLCINASAVPAHLANGGSLGSCEEQSACTSNVSAKLNSSDEDGIEVYNKDLSVYPILSSELITIELNNEINNATYEIVNITGQVVSKGALNESKTELNISSFAPGLYYVKLLNSNIEAEKFIKE